MELWIAETAKAARDQYVIECGALAELLDDADAPAYLAASIMTNRNPPIINKACAVP
jgi:hypothetical protein